MGGGGGVLQILRLLEGIYREWRSRCVWRRCVAVCVWEGGTPAPAARLFEGIYREWRGRRVKGGGWGAPRHDWRSVCVWRMGGGEEGKGGRSPGLDCRSLYEEGGSPCMSWPCSRTPEPCTPKFIALLS